MMAHVSQIHTPVLAEEVLMYLDPAPGGLYVDGTLGLAGHTEAILKASGPDGRVIGFEWDEDAIVYARQRLEPYGERITIVRRNFAELAKGLGELGISMIDGLLIDIGLSSLQLDRGGRGFSFQQDEPLDMRMDNRKEVTAAHLIARCTEEELADIFFYYGEEKQARRIAAEIVEQRKNLKIDTSKKLANVVVKAIPRRFHPKKIHVATQTFQGLRIAVNTELENLANIIDTAGMFLRPGAKFCIITFHSLEDRIVKQKFRDHDQLEVLTTKPVIASEKEVRDNPRARSAKLRVAQKKD
ncbi:MAG: 16S rRNA (cytosine(1402)-N(4))-methyltransferase RsmH [Desulfopila sp.]|jgi:16S rRNA (cytosine1402-N4)-methyltransferase|nr:16S rRNA (cytosine(1402)-N(4))-methyltransferase RsmH [Desulfopila sp.]